jgi:hypothetical protein
VGLLFSLLDVHNLLAIAVITVNRALELPVIEHECVPLLLSKKESGVKKE